MMRTAFVLLAVSATLTARGGEVAFESKPQRAHFIELFTSEGCSSCPPAEEWMNGLKNHPRLWQDIMPVAFHALLGPLGWRDPFASKSGRSAGGLFAAGRRRASTRPPSLSTATNEMEPFPPSETLA